MSSPALSSSSAASSGTTNPSLVHFEDLWLQLKECHKNALHELEAKVIKLKKDRCLDAQRLEEFYGRSQQLKEVQKGLQDTIAKLEGRLLLTAVCARCAPLEEQVRKGQTELEKQRQQNERLIAEHKNEKDSLQDENRKLSKELDRLKSPEAPEEDTPQSSEQEEGMIPDSPLPASAVPAVNKLKRRKTTGGQTKHVRYKEKPRPPLHTSLFGELNKESLEMLQGGGEVLAPNTCQMDTSQTSEGPDLDDVTLVAETCRLYVPKIKEEQGCSTPQQYKVPSRSRQGPGFSVLHPDDTGASPSLLPHGVLHKAKRRKQDLVQELVVEKRKKKNTTTTTAVSLQNNAAPEERATTSHVCKQEPSDVHQGFVIEKRKKNTTTTAVSLQNNAAPEEQAATSHVCKQEPSDVHQALSVQNGAPGAAQTPDVSFLRPANKTKRKSDEGRTRSVLQDLNAPLASAREDERKAEVDQTWSIDPAAALSQYHAGSPDSPEEDRPHNQTETVDADCTFISHSMLQGRGTHAPPHTGDGGSGHRHQKANDSLDEMFDTTAYGEYKSYHNLTHLDHDEPCTDEEEQGEEEEVADNVQKERSFAENPGDDAKENKAGHPAYAHMAVVRNKEERRKLKGSTCKECDIYYAYLPEEERRKKLSECSRHRFRYIPPSTPENFWEVGFPSTQTCVERGYIKEDNNPEPRMRRRQPFNALFSPKRKEEDGLFSPKRS